MKTKQNIKKQTLATLFVLFGVLGLCQTSQAAQFRCGATNQRKAILLNFTNDAHVTITDQDGTTVEANKKVDYASQASFQYEIDGSDVSLFTSTHLLTSRSRRSGVLLGITEATADTYICIQLH